MTMPARDAWLQHHGYLRPLADLHARIDRMAGEVALPLAPRAVWSEYADDFANGLPLLRSAHAAVDRAHIADALAALVARIDEDELPAAMAVDHRQLLDELSADEMAPLGAVASLLDGERPQSSYHGLLRYLGWTVAARCLAPVVAAFRSWRDEERWLRHYCPSCGSAPAMSQLIGSEPGRLRLLACGCCGTRWRFRRTGCPFCRTGDDHRLAGLATDGADPLRIDYCEQCGGYLKTYIGEGDEALWLADWTSLHLDVIARQRGLNRLAGSLYNL
jgi:FdhE protein